MRKTLILILFMLFVYSNSFSANSDLCFNIAIKYADRLESDAASLGVTLTDEQYSTALMVAYDNCETMLYAWK